MDDSFFQWREGDRPSSKDDLPFRSFEVPDSEDESNVTNRSNAQGYCVLESSGDDDTNDLQDSRSSLETRNKNRRNTNRLTNSSDCSITSSEGDPQISKDDVLDESSSDSDIPIWTKKRGAKKIFDDTYEEIADSSETQDKQIRPISVTPDSSSLQESPSSENHCDHDDSVSVLEEDNYLLSSSKSDEKKNSKSAFNGNGVLPRSLESNESTVSHSEQEEIVSGKAWPEEDDKNSINISDDSDTTGTSNDSDVQHVDLVSDASVSSSCALNSNPENVATVLSLIKSEVGVGNIDPLVAQKRAILTFNIEKVQNQLAKSKMVLHTLNIDLLPDKGEKLRRSIDTDETKLQKLSEELESLPKIGTPKPSKPAQGYISSLQSLVKNPSGPMEIKPLGQKALATQEKEQALTVERLADLHGSLNARPSEDEQAQDPKGLKISLMPHQRHALAWLLWREKQKPPGGILADDMGLGKTLTMISLIMSSLKDVNSDNDEDDDDTWLQRKKTIQPYGGTLVVCPASLLSQWETEIKTRVKRGILAVELYHGTNRETVPRRLARNDVVITTYNLISRDYKVNADSILYKINWKRVILDEAHIVRNHKSQQSEAVCHLSGRYRWALTGTPIQNKELDLYALLKFLKCSPFDDLRVWKRWVDNKNAAGQERLATVMKTLMLRRTKVELQAKGGLGSLPDKNLDEIRIKLDPEEQLVYEKVLVFSRTLFAQFLHQRAEKNHMYEMHSGKFDNPSFLKTPKDTQFTKVQNELLARHADVKAHEILVLLLRLRQVCCHPALIHAMLDQEDLTVNDIVDEKPESIDVMSRLGGLKLEDDENIDPNEIGVDRRVVQNLLTTNNPVFNPSRQSSKLRAVLHTIQEILDKGDKMIVVSQWTSMLEVVRSHLKTLNGATYDILSGKIPVKNRQRIVESFNTIDSAPQILLLSLTAGGVGLNLVGGNHLLLLDIHWNPQLEAQAQDRIYRVGQTKSVYIYKFMCLDTVEQRIKALQDRKLEIANGVLTGAGTAAASKLSMDDLKSLFSL
ncbi:transcription termination factor 2 [Neodiprion virginianus]|uniref:transcription termination factor 2 n=1 Tax=Neodiprion virginianus TaxID=2961670 RepID=UPI001EE6E3B6|nr:transcription termination factor 2 [Neodiprion virginianus]